MDHFIEFEIIHTHENTNSFLLSLQKKKKEEETNSFSERFFSSEKRRDDRNTLIPERLEEWVLRRG